MRNPPKGQSSALAPLTYSCMTEKRIKSARYNCVYPDSASEYTNKIYYRYRDEKKIEGKRVRNCRPWPAYILHGRARTYGNRARTRRNIIWKKKSVYYQAHMCVLEMQTIISVRRKNTPQQDQSAALSDTKTRLYIYTERRAFFLYNTYTRAQAE